MPACQRLAGRCLAIALPIAAALTLGACGTIVATADAAGTVVMTGVKVGADVVGATVDVAAAGVHAVTGSGDKK